MNTTALRKKNFNVSPLKHPKGYYVTDTGRIHILYRPNGNAVWRFDPTAVFAYEITLTALEDHSEQIATATEGKA